MKKTYRISLIILVVSFLVTIASCAPKSIDSAKAKLEKEGYRVKIESLSEEDIEAGVIGMIYANKTVVETKKAIIAVLFNSSSDAKKAFSEYKDTFEQILGDIDDFEIKRSGKWIIAGSKTSIEYFKN